MSDSDILAATPEQHLHDLRAVYDMANLRLQPSENAGDGPWSVLHIIPEAHSGSEVSIGVARNIETGDLVEAATGKPIAPGTPVQPGTIEEGSWTVTTRIGVPNGVQSGHYRWTLPTDYRDRKLAPDDIYRPFSSGGNVLCRHNPQVAGVGQFDSVSLLPSGWETQVQPALEALQEDNVPTRSPSSDANKTSLKKLLTSDNSITSTVAFRSLTETGALDPPATQQAISAASGYRRAVMMYVALAHAPATGTSGITEPAFAPTVQGSASPQDDRSTALALAAVALFHKGLPSGTLSVALLNGIRSRSAPSIAGENAPSVAKQASDPYIEELLKTAQIL
jgi:hypothetical protein